MADITLRFSQLSPRTVVFRRGIIYDPNGVPHETLIFLSRLFNYGPLDFLAPDEAYVNAAREKGDLFLAGLCRTDYVAVKAHMVQVLLSPGQHYWGCPDDCEGHDYDTVLARVKAAVLMHLDADAVFLNADRVPLEESAAQVHCNA